MSSAPRNERHCMPRSTAPWTTQKRDEEWTLGRISSSIEPAVKIVLLEEAQRRFEAEDTWWRENRDVKALFIEEFLGLACKVACRFRLLPTPLAGFESLPLPAETREFAQRPSNWTKPNHRDRALEGLAQRPSRSISHNQRDSCSRPRRHSRNRLSPLHPGSAGSQSAAN